MNATALGRERGPEHLGLALCTPPMLNHAMELPPWCQPHNFSNHYQCGALQLGLGYIVQQVVQRRKNLQHCADN